MDKVYCKNCKYVSGLFCDDCSCEHPLNIIVDPVTGGERGHKSTPYEINKRLNCELFERGGTWLRKIKVYHVMFLAVVVFIGAIISMIVG